MRAADLLAAFDAVDVLGGAGQGLWEQVGSAPGWTERIESIARTFHSWSARPRSPGGRIRADVAEAWRLVIDDPGLDALAARAQADSSGGRIVRPLSAPPYGGRDITVKDPEGNLWTIGTYPGETPVRAETSVP